ncbi:uncharacterized protein LOC110893116 [Helianthus annuus]|uniref:uncharacterized protein LOC110893116 n=1 Tax=Helianthus annuus TaxID=4232 RepID=UPI001652BAF1|nr:uncharacterized protein LOC110893116 [Helianthus annuus]
MKELSYDRVALQREHDGYVKCLTAEQERIYKIVMKAIEKGDGGVFFVYGYGGNGKTFLWKTFAAALRSKGEVILNVASSGIASLLLDGGRTAHSRSSDHIFSCRHETDEISLQTVYVCKNKQHLRVGCQETDLQEIKEFAEWILKLGDGLLGEENDGEVDIEILDDLLIHDQVNPISFLISFTYPDMNKFLWDLTYFQQRAILAPTNEVVDSINKELLENLPGEEKIYFSSDTLC